ncbi:MAG: DUF799 family lipoprotein [Proteobacteria bacterium]|nr:DUF799 family lipoprotein [Pseudomonadota bacterium]MBU4102178.1 DUF799 family lipoprotein [Pseudomonadota bacterium]
MKRKHRITKRFLLLIIIFASLYLAGCAAVGTKTAIVSDIKTAFKGTYKVDPYMEKHMPRTIAVLPFIDESKSQKGAEAVRRGFYNHFSSLPFTDMELFRVDHELRKAGLYDQDAINKTPPEKFKEILNVDAVIFGTISNFDKLFAGVYSQVSVGAEIKMYDTQGHFLWSGTHVARIHEGGISTTPVGIVASIIAAAINIRDIQLLRACDDLFRDMVKTIPAVKYAEALLKPHIEMLAQDSKGEPKKAGDIIKVALKGNPGMQAWFDMGGFKKGIDMAEVEPGGYVGSYRVVPGDNIKDVVVTGYLSDDAGNTTSRVDAIQTITLDTTPPNAPKNLTATGRDNIVVLSWDKNTEYDLAGYVVYRSDTPLSGFTKIGQTEFAGFEDKNVINLTACYYKISAVDPAGNESSKEEHVTGTAVPPGPTYVKGKLEKNTIWYAGASPYLIEDTVIIPETCSLLIEPGTIIKSSGGGLVIRGGIIASGSKTQIITFLSVNESALESAWEGITFDSVKGDKNLLVFCRIKNAVTGVEIKSSSPEIRNCEFVKNDIGIKIIGGFSNPQIEDCIIHDNSSAGIEIIDGAKVSITNNRINNNNAGLLIQDAGSVSVKGNLITNNKGFGIVVKNSEAAISKNNIYDNALSDMEGAFQGKAADANDNWWGKADWHDLLTNTNGRINIKTILDGPYPDGKSIAIPVITENLGGRIDKDSILAFSDSPYRVTNDLILDNGATLYIQPGVKLLFDKQFSIIAKDGGVAAMGIKDNPIIFTSSGSSPSPGDYTYAVCFSEPTKVSSFFKYCKFEYATTAIDVRHGMPEIAYCHIVNNSQSGIRCGNDAGPRILYNTIAKNLGTGGIECVGMAKPKIHYNNFLENAVAIQSFSTIYIDARHNFWGKVPPDDTVIWGKNINITPWLEMPDMDAFSITQEKEKPTISTTEDTETTKK